MYNDGDRASSWLINKFGNIYHVTSVF